MVSSLQFSSCASRIHLRAPFAAAERGPGLGADDERGLADELIQLPEGARTAADLCRLVTADGHRQHMIPFLLEIEINHLLQGLARPQVHAFDLPTATLAWMKIEFCNSLRVRRLHLCINSNVPHNLVGRSRVENIVVCAKRAAEGLANIRGTE